MHMFPLNHLQMSMYRISVISSRPRSPPPGVDEIAAVAKAITETEGRRGPVASVGPWENPWLWPWTVEDAWWNPVKPGETRWNPVKPWNMLKMSYKWWVFHGFPMVFWASENLLEGTVTIDQLKGEREFPATETCKLWLVGGCKGHHLQMAELFRRVKKNYVNLSTDSRGKPKEEGTYSSFSLCTIDRGWLSPSRALYIRGLLNSHPPWGRPRTWNIRGWLLSMEITSSNTQIALKFGWSWWSWWSLKRRP